MLGECWKEAKLQGKFYIGFQKARESLFPQPFLLPIFFFMVAAGETKGTGFTSIFRHHFFFEGSDTYSS